MHDGTDNDRTISGANPISATRRVRRFGITDGLLLVLRPRRRPGRHQGRLPAGT